MSRRQFDGALQHADAEGMQLALLAATPAKPDKLSRPEGQAVRKASRALERC